MRFLADMGVSMRVVDWLRAHGHDVVHLREEGLQTLPDKEIFDKALREDRAVITFDLDFGEIMALSGDKRADIMLFRLRNTATPFVIERLDKVLSEACAFLSGGNIIIIEETRYRIRRPLREREG